MIVHTITDVRIINHNFLSSFWYVWIFNNKLVVRVQNYMKTNGKNYNIFLNIPCDVHSYLAKCEIKVQLVYGDKKRLIVL